MSRKIVNRIFIFLALLSAAGVLSANLFFEKEALSALMVSTEQLVTADGTFYDLRDDKNKTDWLRKISPDGLLLAQIGFPKPEGSGYIRRNLVDVTDGWVYLYELAYESASYHTLSEAVTAYDPVSGYSRVVCGSPASALGADECFISKRIWDGKLYLGYLRGDELEIRRVNIDSGVAEEWMRVNLPFVLTWFHVSAQGEVFAASPDSALWRYDGEWKPLFNTEGTDAFAHISVGGDGALYVTVCENGGGRLYRKPPTGDVFETVRFLDAQVVSSEVYDYDNWVDATTDADTHVRGFTGSAAGRSYRFTKLKTPLRLAVSRALWIRAGMEAAAAGLLLLLLRHVCLRKRLRLIEKQMLVALPVFAAGTTLLYGMISSQITEEMYRSHYDELLQQAAEIAEGIDGAKFTGIGWDDPFSDAYYQTLREQATAASRTRTFYWSDLASGASGETLYYTSFWLFRLDGEQARVAACDNIYVNLNAQFIDMDERYRLTKQMRDLRLPAGGKTYDYDSTGADGYWLNVHYPLFDGDTIVGFVEAGRPSQWVDASVRKITDNILVLMVFVLGLSQLAFIAVLNFFLRALKRLKRGAQQIAEGDYGARVKIRSHDETAEIAAAFNQMAVSVEESDRSIRAMRDGYRYFVPGELLTMLGIQSIAEIGPGHYARFNASYLLLFTESFDHYRDKAFFDALNRFYACVIPYLSGEGALIERYAGRGLSALMTRPVSAVLNALISLFDALNRLNADLLAEASPVMECRTLLSLSDALLGVIGNNERLNMIALSRMTYVNEQAGEMCKRYGCRVILTEGAADGLGEASGHYRRRLLGYMAESGNTTSLYDYYDSEALPLMRGKDETRAMFEEAVGHYYNRDYPSARRLFIEVIKQSPHDLAAREYLKQSHRRAEAGLPPGVLLEI